MDTLTPEALRHLYLDDGLTDAEIAAQFKTYQVKINRLRIKWGIPTFIKSDRLNLPDSLPSRMAAILIGSMLGDSGLRLTGNHTARLMEHHSVAQRAYLDWKVSEWGPFISNVVSGDKGEHRGFRFYTHGCRALFPYWQSFYPSGVGEKTFAHLKPGDVDALALAVWFMDDGSKTESYVRFHVGPDDGNQKAQLRLLRHLGLEVALHGADGDVSIHVTGRSSLTKFD